MRLPGFERKQGTSRDGTLQGGAKSAQNDDSIVGFIVVTTDDVFYSALQQIAVARAWRIGRSASVDQAEAIMKAKPAPIVVYDRDSTEDNWRDAVRRLSDLPAHPCVLLASQVADNYLLDEVVRNHGYDILPKSVARERLIQCIQFAWSWARTCAKTGR
jgi:DNA-binding NarL/FixJ family response regulator